MFAAAMDQLEMADINFDRKKIMIERLKNYEIRLIACMRKNHNCMSFKSEFRLNDFLHDMEMYDQVIEDKLLDTLSLEDIPRLSEEGRKLVRELSKSNLDPYIRDFLIMQISCTIKIYDSYDTLGEQDIRRRLRQIKAEVDAHWQEIIIEHESLGERLRTWSGKQLRRGERIAGLIASGATIAGLLPGPAN